MQELQETIIQIYQKNIIFLKKNYFEIYKKIEDLEKNLLETYHLDYIDNHFELIHQDKKIYNCDPFYDGQYRAKNIYNNENIISLIDPNKTLVSYGDIDEEVETSEFINEYVEQLKNIEIPKEQSNKFIFLGTLLGVHLNDIHKVLNSKVYLIIEPNIEIFRLSLFLTDYEEIAQNSQIFFSISQNEEELKNCIINFLKYKSSYNNFIRFELASSNELDLVSKVSEILTLENKIRYPFAEYIYSLKRGFYYLRNNQNGILKTIIKKDFLQEKPILFLAAGPSLDKNVDFIKECKDRFIIVAAAAILKFLESHQIHPDIIISIDAGETTVRNQFDVNKEFFKDSLIISSIKTDPKIYEEINNSNIFFIQTSIEFLINTGLIPGVTVGDIGLKILLTLGAKEIYLLGLDAAIDEKTGETHFSSYYYNKEIQKEEENNYKNYLVDVKGNFNKNVKTTLLYKDMIESINEIKEDLIKGSSIYNLSKGAYFNNTKPLKLLDINTSNFKKFDKNSYIKSLINQLKTITRKELEKIDINEMKKEGKVIKRLKTSKNIEKDFEKLKNNFPTSFVIQILDEFFLLTNPYSSYLEDKSIQLSQINRILNTFEEIYN